MYTLAYKWCGSWCELGGKLEKVFLFLLLFSEKARYQYNSEKYSLHLRVRLINMSLLSIKWEYNSISLYCYKD